MECTNFAEQVSSGGAVHTPLFTGPCAYYNPIYCLHLFTSVPFPLTFSDITLFMLDPSSVFYYDMVILILFAKDFKLVFFLLCLSILLLHLFLGPKDILPFLENPVYFMEANHCQTPISFLTHHS